MNRGFLKALRNPVFIAGVSLLVLGSGPLIIGGLLHEAGLVDIGNGLGFGLLFFFTIWPSLALICAGIVVAAKRDDDAKRESAG